MEFPLFQLVLIAFHIAAGLYREEAGSDLSAPFPIRYFYITIG